MASHSSHPTASNVESSSLSEKFGHWLALYAAYLFLAGWSYLDHYLEVFGISSRWMELGVNETIAHGFAVLFSIRVWLSLVYLGVLLLSIGMELVLKRKSRAVEVAAALVLVILFIPTYLVAKGAGIDQPTIDRGPKTTLPTIIFAEKHCAYHGDLVFIKDDVLYIHKLQPLPTDLTVGKTEPCPIDLSGSANSEVPQLWIIRNSDLTDVRIVHYKE